MASTPASGASSGSAPRKAQQPPPVPLISTGTRPYRSHKVRACDLCRKRKSRCTVDLPGQSCLLCRIQGADCHYREEQPSPKGSMLRTFTNNGNPLPPVDGEVDRKRKHDQVPSATATRNVTSAPAGMGETSDDTRETPNGRPGLGDSMNESVHIVGPVAAEDAQVIERFMPSKRKTPDKKLPYNVYSNDPRNPILYTTVSRRRQGLRASGFPGENQKEILEQILGPFKHDLVNMYVTLTPKVHSRYLMSFQFLR